jgi:hypothetical protein
VKPFYPFIERMIKEAPTLKKLPLFVGHFDLNDLNIHADSQGRVTGIVDWELSPAPEPFGIALYAIHFLAGEIVDKVFPRKTMVQSNGAWLLERADWNSSQTYSRDHNE